MTKSSIDVDLREVYIRQVGCLTVSEQEQRVKSLRRYPVATERWPLVFMGADSRFLPHSPPRQDTDRYGASQQRNS